MSKEKSKICIESALSEFELYESLGIRDYLKSAYDNIVKALKELEEQNMEKIYKGEIQRLMPIFQAMSDGMIIQVSENGNDWIDIDGEEEGLFIDFTHPNG